MSNSQNIFVSSLNNILESQILRTFTVVFNQFF
jgi:hypothetical protein